MEFASDLFSVKLISVLLLDWQKNQVYVPPRPYNALSFRIKGNAVFTDSHKTVAVQDNDILFMPAGVGYHLSSGAEQLLVIHFEIEGKKQNYFEVFQPASPDVFLKLFTSAYRFWQQKKPGYTLRCSCILHKLLELLLTQNRIPSDNMGFEKLKPALRHMQEHFCDSQLTVQQLCELLQISDTYFRKLFFAAFQTTPNKYLNTLRINYAEELLGTGYYTVEQAAERCGFSDTKYFSTVFKKLRGYPPSACKSAAAAPKPIL